MIVSIAYLIRTKKKIIFVERTDLDFTCSCVVLELFQVVFVCFSFTFKIPLKL